jgi:hypothetical protein
MNTSSNLTRLRRFARRLRLAVDVGGGVMMAVTLLAVVLPAQPDATLAVSLNTDGLPRGWAAVGMVFIVLLLATALSELHRMLTRVAGGETFTPQVTRHFRRFTLLLTVVAVSRILLPWLAKAWIGHITGHAVELRLTLDDALLLFFAGVFYFVAEAFDRAAGFETDSKGFV